VEEINKTMCEQNGTIQKEKAKRNCEEILELESTITEMKYSLEEFRGRF